MIFGFARPWLLLLLLMLGAGSLFILYSASGKNLDLLLKQASSFGLGMVGMLLIPLDRVRSGTSRWIRASSDSLPKDCASPAVRPSSTAVGRP